MGAAQFGRGGLAEDHGAGLAQRPHRRVVAFGEVAPKGLAAHLRGHILSLEQILDADGHAVDERERASGLPACRAGIGGLAGAQLVQRHEGFDHGLALRDGLKAALEIGAR